MELLRFDPIARHAGRRLLGRLFPEIAPAASWSTPSLSQEPIFVGRMHELATLQIAHDQARQAPVLALVEGESGVGKSALVRRFLDDLGAAAIALVGRCYEREAVPYKAFDGVIDALSRLLMRLPAAEAAALLPANAALLAQVFPVLQRARAFAAARSAIEIRDPQELRSRVFAALRELLAKLAKQRPVVVVIDDLQWADADSFAMLDAILRGAAAPRILLLATARPGGPSMPAEGFEGSRLQIPLGGLPGSDASALATALCGRASVTVDTAAIVSESGGHPLFIHELVRHSAGAGAAVGGLDEALFSRVVGLGPEARHLLELVVMAGSPIRRAVLLVASEREGADLTRRLAELRAAHLVRSSTAREGEWLEPYHDRVREAVFASLEGAARVECHLRLARALESEGSPEGVTAAPGAAQPEALARHWEGAGDLEKAARHLERAGQAAEAALAFEEASRLYARAIELGQQVGSVALALRLRLAGALANAGRGGDAGAAYLVVAEHESGTEALRLRRLAADQFLRNGLIDRGIALLAEVLPAVGVSLPKTRFAKISTLLWARARLRLRGFGYRERGADEISPRNLERLDVCQSAGNSLSAHDTVLGAVFGARTLLWALEAGEPGRVARGLVLEAGYSASAGPTGARRSEELLAEARRLVERLDEPYLHLYLAGTKGVCDFLLAGWREAVEELDQAMAYGRERCTGVHWELGFAETMAQTSLYFLGELVALSTRARETFHEARSRGDTFLVTNTRIGLPAVASLAADDPRQTERRADRAMRAWSNAGFHAEHFWALFSRVEVALYRHEGKRALWLVRESWRALCQSLLLRVQIFRVLAHHLRACALLSAAAAALGPAEARPLVREAMTFGRKLGRERMAYASGLGALALAGAQALAGRPDAARAHLQAAIVDLDRAQMRLYAAAARHFLAPLVGGEEGTALHAEAAAVAIQQGVVAPHRFFGMLAPGFQGGAHQGGHAK